MDAKTDPSTNHQADPDKQARALEQYQRRRDDLITAIDRPHGRSVIDAAVAYVHARREARRAGALPAPMDELNRAVDTLLNSCEKGNS